MGAKKRDYHALEKFLHNKRDTMFYLMSNPTFSDSTHKSPMAPLCKMGYFDFMSFYRVY